MCMSVCSVMSYSFTTPWTGDHQAPLSMEFFRQEYWSGLPFSSPKDLPNPGIEPTSLASPTLAGNSWPVEPPGKPKSTILQFKKRKKQKVKAPCG